MHELREDPLPGRWVAVMSNSKFPGEYDMPPEKDPPFNYVIHMAPNRIPRRNHWHTLGDDFHWHIEIMPRLLGTGGFEWGSGFYVLTTSPEDAAKYLREA